MIELGYIVAQLTAACDREQHDGCQGWMLCWDERSRGTRVCACWCHGVAGVTA